MMLVIQGLVSPAETRVLREAAQGLSFGDGKATAGKFAREVKANDQALPSPERAAILGRVDRALRENALFRSAARPKEITPLILSRYRVGQTYGLHVDDAVMGGIADRPVVHAVPERPRNL